MTHQPVAPNVQAIFDNYEPAIQTQLMQLRELILGVAAKIDGVGELEETLKWGQPSYVTPSKSGTTIRIDRVKQDPQQIALYVPCQTNLIESWRTLFPQLEYESQRAIRLNINEPLPIDALQDCISLALTYHARKKAPAN